MVTPISAQKGHFPSIFVHTRSHGPQPYIARSTHTLLNNGVSNDPAKITHSKMAFLSRPFCPCSKQQIQACVGIAHASCWHCANSETTHSGREQCNCSTATACSALSKPCSSCSAAHLPPSCKGGRHPVTSSSPSIRDSSLDCNAIVDRPDL